MNITYKVHKYELLGLCPGKNTRNRRGCFVRYQLFPVLVMFSVQHQSAGSTSFNTHLPIRKFSLRITLRFLFQSTPFPASLRARSWRRTTQPALEKGQRWQTGALRGFVSVSLQKEPHPTGWACCCALCSQQRYSDGLCEWGLPFWERGTAKGFLLRLCGHF